MTDYDIFFEVYFRRSGTGEVTEANIQNFVKRLKSFLTYSPRIQIDPGDRIRSGKVTLHFNELSDAVISYDSLRKAYNNDSLLTKHIICSSMSRNGDITIEYTVNFPILKILSDLNEIETRIEVGYNGPHCEELAGFIDYWYDVIGLGRKFDRKLILEIANRLKESGFEDFARF